MIDFKQLEAIYWLRELNSFQQVADRLHITQPAVSARIATLEEGINARLIVRQPKGVALTSLGREVADHAERLIVQREVMLEQVRRDRKTSLRVSLVGPIMHTWGPLLRQRLLDSAPQLSVEFTIGSTVQVERDVQAGASDLAFVSLLPNSSAPSAQFSVEYDVGWIGSPSMAESINSTATSCTATMSELGNCELILYPPTSPLFSPIASTITDMQGPRHFANSLSSILDMLRSGYGISAIPISAAFNDLETGRLARIRTEEEIQPLTVYCKHVSKHRQKQATTVLEIAESVAQEFAAKPNSAMRCVAS